jgi:ubiquinone/menaquinone biosynthesis C-methylase UbiE
VNSISDKHNNVLGDTQDMALDERQHRERDYHEEFAKRNRDKVTQHVPLDVIGPGPRRPWNGHWTAYDLLMAESLAGKRVMVPGCGFGEDAIRLAKLNAEVHAFDLSPDLLEIARQRAARMAITGIHFDVMPAEALAYPDDFFDLVYFNDILHHINIPKAVVEARRVLKSGGKVIANELYTHSLLQWVRESRLVSGFVYPRMVRFIYGTDKPYITEDEHKINERELEVLTAILRPGSLRRRYFLLFGGRILPARREVEKFDRVLLAITGPAGRILAGRVVLAGTVAK